MATRSTGERDHAALFDIEAAAKGFREVAERNGHPMTRAESLRLGIYYALVASELGYTPDMAATVRNSISKKLA